MSTQHLNEAKSRPADFFDSAALERAYFGSYYTIIGVGDETEFIQGYEELLAENGIAKPSQWIRTSGSEVNDYMESDGTELGERDRFRDDCTFLLFPLDGIEIGGLSLFKLRMDDRWFDDIVENTRRNSSSR